MYRSRRAERRDAAHRQQQRSPHFMVTALAIGSVSFVVGHTQLHAFRAHSAIVYRNGERNRVAEPEEEAA